MNLFADPLSNGDAISPWLYTYLFWWILLYFISMSTFHKSLVREKQPFYSYPVLTH